MPASRIALYAAIGAAVAWAAKAVAIGAAGGLDRSALEGPLFLLGLVSGLVGAGALGVALTVGRPLWQRVAASALGIVVFLLVVAVTASAMAALTPADPGWVWSEVNLWVSAVLLVVAALVVSRSPRARPRAD